MEWLQPLCNVIILIGGACMAIKNISEWCGKPIKLFKQKNEDNFETKVVKILKDKVPTMLLQHDIETRTKYRSDRETYLQEIKNEVLQSIQSELALVAQLAEQYENLVISAKDVLREKIMQIYFKNKQDKTLTYHEKEALDQYYKDYKKMKGNSYIDKYYNRMLTWKIVDDDYDDTI